MDVVASMAAVCDFRRLNSLTLSSAWLRNIKICLPPFVFLDMLSRFSKLRILRIYGREKEVHSFPEIGTIFGTSIHGKDHSTQLDTSIQEAALHFRIRRDTNPFSGKIRKCTQLINVLKESGKDRKQLSRVLEKCRKVIEMAEEYELSENNGKVIMCTCIEAGSSRIRDHGNIRQCIIDESNMCLEAESLVVLEATSASCYRIVMVGDLKQLRPIVHNRIARKFGLGRSLFHSLLNGKAKKKFSSHVLETQYRMVSLCLSVKVQLYLTTI